MDSKKVFLFCGVSVGFSVALLLSAELAVRLFIRLNYNVPGKSYGIYQADQELGAVHRPNSYNMNSMMNNWGLRNVEDIPEQKLDGGLRIYCSGGSTTFCYNLTTQESWPNLLQDKLRTAPGHERDEVLNAGEICFAVSQEFALAKRLIPRLKPDIVLLFTGINESLDASILKNVEKVDLDRLLREKKWGVFPKHLDQARFLKRNSALVRFFEYYPLRWLQNWKTARFRESSSTYRIHPWTIENFKQTLRSYIRFLRDQGCQVIVVRYGDNGADDWYITQVLLVFRDLAVQIAREEGAEVCDIASVVEKHPRRTTLFIESGVHLTKEGADLMSQELLKLILGSSSAMWPRN